MCGWQTCGVRVGNDQVWGKPPRGAPLAFHRDEPYFKFRRLSKGRDDRADAVTVAEDKEVGVVQVEGVVTLWLALDDMTSDIGPLELYP